MSELWERFRSSGDVCLLNELVLELVSGHLNSEGENVLEVLHKLFQFTEFRGVLQSTLLDVLWLFDLEAEISSHSANSSFDTDISADSAKQVNCSPIVLLAKELFEQGFIDVSLALERLEPSFLEAFGVIASADLLHKKLIKLNTAVYYRQQKYNLLREESEGFSRLLVMLAESNSLEPQLVFDRVMVMIGTFDLDPIRVLDLILDEFTFHFAPRLYLPLLKMFTFPASTMISLLGFKLEFAASEEGKKFGVEYFEALFRMIASLLAEGLISLPALYPRLLPSDGDCEAELGHFSAELAKAAAKMGVVNLAGAADKESANLDAVAKSLEPESLSEQFAADAFAGKLLELSPARNQKVHLVMAFLHAELLEEAKIVLESLTCLLSLHPAIPALVSKHPQLHHLLQPGHLAYNLQLFVQICRSKPSKEVIARSLLPALTLSGSNALLFAQELWSVLREFTYQERYSLYGVWASIESPVFDFAKASAVAEAKKVIRRLAKETVRQYGRLVAKVTHSSPHVIIPLILGQVQVYDNLIPSVVEAFRFLTPLSFDVLMWSLLGALSSSERDRLKEDGVNVADWLQNLARFASSLIRRHYASIDPAPLLRFVYAQLCDDNGLDVILLQELLTLVAGIEKPENDSEALIEAQFGGPLLQSTIIEAAQVSSRPPRRAFTQLKAALEGENLTKPLLIALAQAVDAAVYRMDYEHLKFTASLVDVLQSTLQQYLRFLKAGGVEIDLSFSELIFDFKLTKASALFLLTALGKPLSFENNETFLQLFWSLEAIRVPEARYQLEVSKLIDLSAKEKLQLELELTKQARNEQLTTLSARLVPSLGDQTDRNLITDTAIHSAIFPRLLQSPNSAILCADFLFFCHDREVKNLSTLALFDAIFDLPLKVLPCLTEFESNCFGRFVHECLGKLQLWHQSEDLYTVEARKLGFLKRWSELIGTAQDVEDGQLLEEVEEVEDGELTADSDVSNANDTETKSCETNLPQPPEVLSWQDFRHVCFKWHDKLTSALLFCFSSADFTSIRNAIIFSSLLQGTFPKLEKQSRSLEAAITALKETDSREDVKVLATRYSALLAQNRPHLLKASKFHESDEPDEEVESVTVQTEKIKLKRSASEVAEEGASKRSRSSRESSRREGRDSRDTRDGREVRDAREVRDGRELRDGRDVRDASDVRDARDVRNGRDVRDARDYRSPRGTRDPRDTRDARDPRDTRDTRDNRDSTYSRDSRDSRYSAPSRGRDSSRHDSSRSSRRY